eukprot:286981_1
MSLTMNYPILFNHERTNPYRYAREILNWINFREQSFLDQNDYIDFSMSNRSTYLGCNSPNTLQALDLDFKFDIDDYSSINAVTFASLKYLRIDPSKAIHFDSHSFSQVRCLRLYANTKRGWVQPFFNQNIVNCDHVTTLSCDSFGDVSTKMQGKEFLSLLTRFPNLMHLRMHKVFIANDITGQDIAAACPKVVGVKIRDDKTPIL